MMKHKLLFFLLLAASISIHWSPAVDAAKESKLSITYKVINIEEGYDHMAKLTVYVDDEEVGSSKEQVQSKGGSFTTTVSKGKHDIKAVLMAKYEGVWEEHTIENDYSYDCVVETSANFGKSRKMSITFDLDSGVKYKLK